MKLVESGYNMLSSVKVTSNPALKKSNPNGDQKKQLSQSCFSFINRNLDGG